MLAIGPSVPAPPSKATMTLFNTCGYTFSLTQGQQGPSPGHRETPGVTSPGPRGPPCPRRLSVACGLIWLFCLVTGWSVHLPPTSQCPVPSRSHSGTRIPIPACRSLSRTPSVLTQTPSPFLPRLTLAPLSQMLEFMPTGSARCSPPGNLILDCEPHLTLGLGCYYCCYNSIFYYDIIVPKFDKHFTYSISDNFHNYSVR